MTIGGRIARALSTIQPDSDSTLSARPAAHSAKTQTAVTMAFMVFNRIFKSVPAGAVRRCPRVHSDLARATDGHRRPRTVPSSAKCSRLG